MITDRLIQSLQTHAFGESEKYNIPPKALVEYTNEKGQLLADKMHADKMIVLCGTLLMDCQLGCAFQEKRMKEHVEMGIKKAEELLLADKDITKEEKLNILACVREHHGTTKFSTLESEVCCNADCYKFVSTKGMIISIRYMRDSMDEMIKLFIDKVHEKWHALSFDICKKELEPQYKSILEFLQGF